MPKFWVWIHSIKEHEINRKMFWGVCDGSIQYGKVTDGSPYAPALIYG